MLALVNVSVILAECLLQNFTFPVHPITERISGLVLPLPRKLISSKSDALAKFLIL
jgi:hypothetical protein